MNAALLDILRCPFCGAWLRLLKGRFLEAENDRITTGILGCQCCAYPIVAGIPYLRTGAAAETAMHLLGEGERELALFTLLGLDERRQASFRGLLHDGRALTFRGALDVLSPDAEASYLFYRFSDPTYLCSRAVLRAVGQDRRCAAGRALDLGGGAGHLTRALCELGGEVVLADVAYWKVWLAQRFLAPRCQPVCCNANEPLPFAPGTFSLVFSSDAFHYVWSRRLLASELLRLAGSGGAVLLTHLHNLLCENESAGMPLAPADYRSLFEGVDVRLFKESDVLAGLLEGRPVDVSVRYTDDDLREEPALILLATRLHGLFRQYDRGHKGEAAATLSVNPLYRLEQNGEGQLLSLHFPSAGYEGEYAACRRYLPDKVAWGEEREARVKAGTLDGELRDLADRHVLLELPCGYC